MHESQKYSNILLGAKNRNIQMFVSGSVIERAGWLAVSWILFPIAATPPVSYCDSVIILDV